LWQVPPISNFLWPYWITVAWPTLYCLASREETMWLFDTHSEWNPSLGLQTGQNSAHYAQRTISIAELGLVLIGSLRVSSTHLKHVNAMLWLSTGMFIPTLGWPTSWWMSEVMHQTWFQKAFGGVLCIFTNFVLMSGMPGFWEVTVGGCHWSTGCDDPSSSVLCKPVINIPGGCFPGYFIVSLSFSLRFRSVSCLHYVWATKILPLSLNGVPDHILEFGCRRQMEDFHTVCRSKPWQTAKLSCGMVYTIQGAGLIFVCVKHIMQFKLHVSLNKLKLFYVYAYLYSTMNQTFWFLHSDMGFVHNLIGCDLWKLFQYLKNVNIFQV